jgi:hypothetical protein
MNKTYEIEYHINDTDLHRDVVTVDGRSARENRTPTCLITHAEEQARTVWKAYRYEIRLIKLPHITATGVQIGVTHLVYTGTVDENC